MDYGGLCHRRTGATGLDILRDCSANAVHTPPLLIASGHERRSCRPPDPERRTGSIGLRACDAMASLDTQLILTKVAGVVRLRGIREFKRF